MGSAGVDAAAIDVFNEALGKAGNQSEASAASNTRECLGCTCFVLCMLVKGCPFSFFGVVVVLLSLVLGDYTYTRHTTS